MSNLTRMPDVIALDDRGVEWLTERWADADGVVRAENTYPAPPPAEIPQEEAGANGAQTASV